MKNKKIILLILSTVLLSLAGCGDGLTPEEREAANQQESDIPELLGIPIDDWDTQTGQGGQEQSESELERQIRELERRCGTPDFTQEEYLTLAELYGSNGQVKKQRDTLEICFSLFQDSSAGEQLQQLTVNVSEEDSGIQEQMARLEQNLSIAEYVNEAVSMLHGEEWLETMMPRLNQGTRGYYQELTEGSLYVRTGYDEGGVPYTQVQRRQGDQLTVLLQTTESVQLLETSVEDGSYDGVYESWTVLASSGDVIRENGNFRSGVLVGDYTAQIRWGRSADDLLPLWNMREDMETITYNGNFGENGISTVDQPGEGQIQVTHGGGEADSVIVYAYDTGKQNYLFVNREETETTENYIFRAEAMGMPVLETYAAYEPKADQGDMAPAGTIDLARLQVRVYDGNIEVYDGTGWINMGAAKDYLAADPLGADQAAGSQPGDNPNAGGTGSSKIAAIYANRGGGQIASAATPKPTSKPAAPTVPVAPVAPVTPTVPVAPVPTQAPATPSNPAPATPSNPAPAVPGNPGPGTPGNPEPAPQPDPTPEPAPQPDPTPEPAPAPTDPPISGGDTDVDWSPDIM